MFIPSSPLFLAISVADFACLLVAVILCLDVVWRTKGSLDIFAKLLTVTVLFRLGERLVPLLNISGRIVSESLLPGLIADLLLTVAAAELYHIIRKLDGETK